MSCSGMIIMEASENGLWRLCKNTTGRPPSSDKWIHVTGPYFREAPGGGGPRDWLRPTAMDHARTNFAPPNQPSSA
jgi:hypothetical protein